MEVVDEVEHFTPLGFKLKKSALKSIGTAIKTLKRVCTNDEYLDVIVLFAKDGRSEHVACSRDWILFQLQTIGVMKVGIWHGSVGSMFLKFEQVEQERRVIVVFHLTSNAMPLEFVNELLQITFLGNPRVFPSGNVAPLVRTI